MADNDFIWRFTPSRTEPELLESIFVQRQALLKDIQERVADSVTSGNMHHVLLIGPRGIGKTHLISLLHHRVTQDPALTEKLRIAWFLEDETITSFVQLLKRIYELLSDEYPHMFPAEWLESQLDKPPAQIEKNLEAELVRQFQDKTLLLFIENLDYVFDGLGLEGQKKWRSFLQEHPFTCIVATSQRLFRGVQKRTEPFFGFFAPIHLHPLKVSDAVELLSHIAKKRNQTDLLQFLQTPDGRSRVRAIHHLAGGNHRIYIVLSGFITRDSLDELTQPFEKMADELTPYYQERMRWLSPQQRQIVEFLCSQDSPCTPKEMARQMLAGENTISSQLKKLLEYGYVLRSPRGRESLYELAEPLMRLASEIKEKRTKPLRLLVDFLRIWYRPEQLLRMMQHPVSQKVREHLSAAFEKAKTSPDPRLAAISNDIDQAHEEGRMSDARDPYEERATITGKARDWMWFGAFQQITGGGNESNDGFRKAAEIDPFVAHEFAISGICLLSENEVSEMIPFFQEQIDSAPLDWRPWICKGAYLASLGEIESAFECFDKSLDLYPKNSIALAYKGRLLLLLGRAQEAEKCYSMAKQIRQDFDVAAFGHADSLCAMQLWEDGFNTLREAFSQHPQSDNCRSDIMIQLLQHLAFESQRAQALVNALTVIYSDNHALTHLGEGLIQSLGQMNVERLSLRALDEWRDIWLEAGSKYPEMELPLRIFRVGIEYLKTKDERVMLDLITTERRILRQAVGLEEMTDDEAKD